MWKLSIAAAAVLVMSMPVCSQQPTTASMARPQRDAPQTDVPQPGELVSRETCITHPDQTYALYLPANYNPEKKWPIIYAFDPVARGERPVELMKNAAERYGYIVAGSNNSRNGSWKVEVEAAQAVSDDTRARLSIDTHRVYFVGFSGGARVASQIARNCKCAAGVILNGAGFPIRATPSRDSVFPVFATVGTLDFNYPEVTRLSEALETAGFPHFLRYFDGPHQWAPASVMEEAFAWLRLVAMKQNLEPRDASFIEQQHAAALSRARSLEQSGDLYAAWREYGQCALTFDQLADTSALRQAVTRLATQKRVRDGAKREKREFEEQENLTNDISAGLAALREVSDTLAATLNQTDHKIISLRESAGHERHPDRARVLHRAVSGILVEALEAGNDRLEAKDITRAKDYFQLAADADPDSIWALSGLATAYALNNDRKGALEALLQARAKTKDPTAFSAWLKMEPAFARFREDPQFLSLLQLHEND